jgi:hypothetical protein
MSRFIERLTKLYKIEPQPMGFATNRPSASKSRLPLAVILSSKNLEKTLESLGEVDGVLVRVAAEEDLKIIEKVCQKEENPPAGGLLSSAEKIPLHSLKKGSCDFMVVPADSQASPHEDEKMGRLVQLDSGLSEALLRTVNDLPVDAVIFTENIAAEGLTLINLMAVRRLVLLISKPILLVVPLSLSQDELQALWNTGISGIVADLPDPAAAKKLGDLRKTLEKLATPSLNKKDKMSAILPRMGLEPALPSREDDDGEEEEDF